MAKNKLSFASTEKKLKAEYLVVVVVTKGNYRMNNALGSNLQI